MHTFLSIQYYTIFQNSPDISPHRTKLTWYVTTEVKFTLLQIITCIRRNNISINKVHLFNFTDLHSILIVTYALSRYRPYLIEVEARQIGYQVPVLF